MVLSVALTKGTPVKEPRNMPCHLDDELVGNFMTNWRFKGGIAANKIGEEVRNASKY